MPCSHLRFLIVEDEPFQRHAVSELLKGLGAAAVYPAEDGQEALKVLSDPERPVDIVICDISMPGMDGLEFVRRLSESRLQTSLVLASALEGSLISSVASLARAYKLPLLGALAKPISAVKLRPLVELHRRLTAGAQAEPLAFSLTELADAWAENQFETWFEPRVHVQTGKVTGMSAHLRWRHPARGLLEPQAFTPTLQARGLSEDFAWLGLQRGLRCCAQWQQAGLDLQLAVPLPVADLADAHTAARVHQLAVAEGVELRRVSLGISERLLDVQQPRTLECLVRLRMYGFGLALEDFGDGPMDIERLCLVPFTELAIQSGFVTAADHDSAARAGVAVALETAQQLNLTSVGRGIATEGQWQLLRDWGCDIGLGPHVAAPVSAEAVPEWVQSRNGPVAAA